LEIVQDTAIVAIEVEYKTVSKLCNDGSVDGDADARVENRI